MPKTITITLSEENRNALQELGEQSRLDEIVNRALSDYLFIRRFRELRARMVSGIEKIGVQSDEDVFRLAS